MRFSRKRALIRIPKNRLKKSFLMKLNKTNYPLLNFNNTAVTQSATHKNLQMILNAKLQITNIQKSESLNVFKKEF